MTDPARTPSVPDDVLVRYIDGEASPAEAGWVESAGASLATTLRLRELREMGDRLSADLSAIPVPPPPALPVVRPRWRAAAAVVALLLATGVAAALPTTRALVGNGIGRALTWMGASGAGVPAGADGSATIGIPVAGAEFVVDVSGRVSGGSLRIHRGDGGEVLVAAPGAEVLVLPGGVRLRVVSGDAGDVTVTVPRGLLRLRVRYNGTERVVDLAGRDVGEAIPLAPGR